MPGPARAPVPAAERGRHPDLRELAPAVFPKHPFRDRIGASPEPQEVPVRRLPRLVLSTIAGYALMVVLITLVQESWFGGVGWRESSLPVLAVAGLLTCVAGAAGAAAATALAAHAGRTPARLMALLVVVETTTLLLTGRLGGPLWFDVLAALSLIASILLGAELVLRPRRLPRRPAVA